MKRRDTVIKTAKSVAPFVQIAVGAVLFSLAFYQFLGRAPPEAYVQPMIIMFVIGGGSFLAAVIFALRYHRDNGGERVEPINAKRQAVFEAALAQLRQV
jgi:hypothetical protein